MNNNWNYEKLKQMNNQEIEYTKIKLDYMKLAEKIEEILIITRKNGDVIPLVFDDVKLAYNGNLLSDLNLPKIPDEYLDKYNQLDNNRKVMHLKHFSRDISHDAWFDFLDKEVNDFIKKYPQFKNIIKE